MKHPLFLAITIALAIALLYTPGALSSVAMAGPVATPSAKKPTRTAQAARTPAKTRQTAAASSQSRGGELTGRKLKTLIFGEGDDIEGNTLGPAGEDVTVRPDITHTNLIRVRQHFLPEIYKSAEQM